MQSQCLRVSGGGVVLVLSLLVLFFQLGGIVADSQCTTQNITVPADLSDGFAVYIENLYSYYRFTIVYDATGPSDTRLTAILPSQRVSNTSVTSQGGNLHFRTLAVTTVPPPVNPTSTSTGSTSSAASLSLSLFLIMIVMMITGKGSRKEVMIIGSVIVIAIMYTHAGSRMTSPHIQAIECSQNVELVMHLPAGTEVHHLMCPDACNGHGTCDEQTGICSCNNGWDGDYCDTKIPSSANATVIDVNNDDWTYTLQESTSGFKIWTAPITHRVLSNESAPSVMRSGLRMAAARNEFEPVQIVLPKSSQSVSISFSGMETLSNSTLIGLSLASFSSGMADKLVPFNQGDNMQLSNSQINVIWITFYIPNDPMNLPAGWYNGTMQMKVGSNNFNIPFSLYVFNFALESAPNFKSQVNIPISPIASAHGSVDAAKALLYFLRVAPTSVAWPSGLGWQISWDNTANGKNSNSCKSFNDEPYEQPQYAAYYLTRRYAMGEGWYGTGFSANELFQFIDAENKNPRPSKFCGHSIGNQYGNDDYNEAWNQYIVALEQYLINLGNDMINKSYWYVQNEPQNDDDYKLAAFLCQMTKQVAPDLKIAVSKQPIPDIAERDDYGPCGYDIWIAYIGLYAQAYAWERQSQYNETVWFYNLPQDAFPYFSPAKDDIGLVEGTNVRVIPWVAWTNRVVGWAYYYFQIFFDDAWNPKIGAFLFREAFEDYEYLFEANGKQHPQPYVNIPLDQTSAAVGTSVSTWNQSPAQIHALRWALGQYVEGSRTSAPMLAKATPPSTQSIYINFQDPKGQPTDDPLIVDSITWQKIGWNLYNSTLGYGWSGQYIGNADIMKYGYRTDNGGNVIQDSYIYNDYGRPDTFYYNLSNGDYNVTVGIGLYGQQRSDLSFVSIQGTTIYNQACCAGQNLTQHNHYSN